MVWSFRLSARTSLAPWAPTRQRTRRARAVPDNSGCICALPGPRASTRVTASPALGQVSAGFGLQGLDSQLVLDGATLLLSALLMLATRDQAELSCPSSVGQHSRGSSNNSSVPGAARPSALVACLPWHIVPGRGRRLETLVTGEDDTGMSNPAAQESP